MELGLHLFSLLYLPYVRDNPIPLLYYKNIPNFSYKFIRVSSCDCCEVRFGSEEEQSMQSRLPFLKQYITHHSTFTLPPTKLPIEYHWISFSYITIHIILRD